MNAVIYARYSSHAQREESIEQQVEECRAYAEHEGLSVIDVYEDRAISGRTDHRSGFQRMMRDAQKRRFDIVIAYKSNRIARNMLNALQYESKLAGYGIKTVYCKEEFGDTAAGRFALRTMMNVNQFYSENMGEDIRRGMMDNALDCKSNGHLPYGYVRGEDGRYAILEKEAETVREIYRRVLSGDAFMDIARDLNDRNIRTKRGAEWTKNSFHRIVTNDAYIGTYRFKDVVIQNGIPAIISPDDFEAVQELLHVKRQPIGRHRSDADYYLTGKLYCGHCGSAMVGISGTGRHGQTYYYYTCTGKKSGCQKENVRKDLLERRVVELARSYVLTDEMIEYIADAAVQLQRDSLRTSDAALWESQLADNRSIAANLMRAIEGGAVSKMITDRLCQVEADISLLEHKISRYAESHKIVDRDEIIYSLSRFRDGDLDDDVYIKHIIDAFVQRVTLYDDHIDIRFWTTGTKPDMTSALWTDNSGVCIKPPVGHHTLTVQTPVIITVGLPVTTLSAIFRK